MPSYLILLTLFAALLHAGWNALLRGGDDRLWSMSIMCVAIAAVCVLIAPFMPMPARASWPCALLSLLLHVVYNLCLVCSYRCGDL
ncbi:MAG TPA: EamA family transporter, partial [Pantoea sp.]|nr:EamA family transporter [Pantoea sp.]